MRSGPLDTRITIQRQQISHSDSGQEETTWADVATVWADKIENRGSERFAARQITGHAVRTFRFRWSTAVSEITAEHQILHEGVPYDITDVREIGRHDGIEVDCFTGSDQAVTS